MGLNLNNILMGSDDPKTLIDFYTKVIGEPVWADMGYTSWQAGDGWLTVGAHDQVKGRNEAPGRIIINFETPDVEQEFARIKGLGAPVVAEPYDPTGGQMKMLMATFEDPDGNYFQIATPVTQEMMDAWQQGN